jgi:FkbM family methyltransferase
MSLIQSLGSRVPAPFKAFIRKHVYDVPIRKWHSGCRQCPLMLAPDVKMDLVPGDLLSDLITATGWYEPELSREVLEIGQRGGRMVQVGANLGYFCLLWASANTANEVYAIEAHLDNVALLRRNVTQNGFAGRIHVLPVAAGRTNGLTSFDDGPADQRGWGGIAASGRPTPVLRLDDLFPSESIDVLLIDTEGADTWVLEGARELLRERRIKTLFFEQNLPRMEQLGIEPDAAQAFLRDAGYHAEMWVVHSDAIREWRAQPLS